MASTPIKGMRFLHSRVLSTLAFDGKTPQTYVVTKIAMGCVFYRPVYDYGTREELGKSEYCDLFKFEKVCLEVVTAAL